MLTLSQLTSVDPIGWAILSYLPLPDYYRIIRINQHFKALHLSTLFRRFPIHDRLQYYFDNPSGFRLLQAQTGLIISGSFALQFLLGEHWPSSDLNLYVVQLGGEFVGEWLMNNGYHFCPMGPLLNATTGEVEEPGQPLEFLHALHTMQGSWLSSSYSVYGVVGVFNFTREVRGSVRKVQLVTVVTSPIETIMSFRSTCVMNVIAYNKVYCLYPRATLNRRFNLALNPFTPALRVILDKYRDRQWTNFRLVTKTMGDWFLGTQVRWIEDVHSLVVELPEPDGIHPWPQYRTPLSVTTWSISLRPNHYHYTNLETIRLKHSIHPLFTSTRSVEEKIEAICGELWAHGRFVAENPTLTGEDVNTQLVVNNLKSWLDGHSFDHAHPMIQFGTRSLHRVGNWAL